MIAVGQGRVDRKRSGSSPVQLLSSKADERKPRVSDRDEESESKPPTSLSCRRGQTTSLYSYLATPTGLHVSDEEGKIISLSWVRVTDIVLGTHGIRMRTLTWRCSKTPEGVQERWQKTLWALETARSHLRADTEGGDLHYLAQGIL